ncbi:RNase adapter RapZ [Myxococcota bacterium]|nr:RNase adapter RapZ [Myxococcota bacterium]MBU1432954.1 RNase adapter RapZ [Myxococcota bacterium]MBU1896308.1 RNase adapter RapZ [Myxococcota bacterium]
MNERRLIVVTGLSGSGITTAVDALEDMGFFCVDNLPPTLLPKLIELVVANERYHHLALGLDARSVAEPQAILEVLDQTEGVAIEILFLEASEAILLRRFSASRRPHPLSQRGLSLLEALKHERLEMHPFRERASVVLDTSEMNVHDCKAAVQAFSSGVEPTLRLSVMSFGFKHGSPREADIVWDVRFLPNPHFQPALRPHSGLEAVVRDYVLEQPMTRRFLERLLPLLEEVLPGYERERKSYLTIAIGCTGGRHRSVALAERIAEHLRQTGRAPRVRHRDIEKES